MNTPTTTPPLSELIYATIQWDDDQSIHDVIIKQTDDVGDNDDEIFFYGLTWAEVVQCITRKRNPDSADFKIIGAHTGKDYQYAPSHVA